jgi:hypothetical protein
MLILYNINFTVITELSSISVLNELVNFFNCGTVYTLVSSAARYQVQIVDENLDKIYPMFRNHPFNTVKQTHFEKTIEVCKLIKIKGYKSDDDLKAIVDLAWDMNNSGKICRLSKIEYLSKYIKNEK